MAKEIKVIHLKPEDFKDRNIFYGDYSSLEKYKDIEDYFYTAKTKEDLFNLIDSKEPWKINLDIDINKTEFTIPRTYIDNTEFDQLVKMNTSVFPIYHIIKARNGQKTPLSFFIKKTKLSRPTIINSIKLLEKENIVRVKKSKSKERNLNEINVYYINNKLDIEEKKETKINNTHIINKKIQMETEEIDYENL